LFCEAQPLYRKIHMGPHRIIPVLWNCGKIL